MNRLRLRYSGWGGLVRRLICRLRKHDWRPENIGLTPVFQQPVCKRCGERGDTMIVDWS